MKRRWIIRCFLIAMLMLCVGGWATTVLIYRATRPERIVWDLSHGDTTDAVHWPKGLGGSGFERTAHYLDLTIISDGFRPAVSGYQMPPAYCRRRSVAGSYFTATRSGISTCRGKPRILTGLWSILAVLLPRNKRMLRQKIMTDWHYRPENLVALDYLARRYSEPGWHRGDHRTCQGRSKALRNLVIDDLSEF